MIAAARVSDRHLGQGPGIGRVPVAALAYAAMLSGALACSCVAPKAGDPLPDIVVDATVLAVHRDAANRPQVNAVLRVHQALRGAAPYRSQVTTPLGSAACGVSFQPGQRIRLAMIRSGSRFATSTCLNLRYRKLSGQPG